MKRQPNKLCPICKSEPHEDSTRMYLSCSNKACEKYHIWHVRTLWQQRREGEAQLPTIAELQSTITAQSDLIRRLRDDSQYWYSMCAPRDTGIWCDDILNKEADHTALMNDIEKSTHD